MTNEEREYQELKDKCEDKIKKARVALGELVNNNHFVELYKDSYVNAAIELYKQHVSSEKRIKSL